MSYPKPKIANSEIDLKLGIKSSLPNATQAIVLSYLIWKCGDKKSNIAYSKQNGDGLFLKDELSVKISELLQNNIEQFNKSDFDKHILNNPLLKAQIEALIVGFELVWKLARFQFVDGSSFSAERTGGKRFEKIISFTSNIDVLDLLVQSKEKDFLQLFYEVLIQSTISNITVFDSFRKLLTVFSETAIYKIEHGGNDLIFDNLGVYKSVLEDNNVILSDDKENKGASRILKSSATEGLNFYLSGKSGAFEKNQNLTDDELKNYAERVENFLALTNIKINESNKQLINNESSIGTIPYSHNRIVFGAPGTGKSNKLNKDAEKYFSEINDISHLMKEEIKNRPQDKDKEPWFNHIGIKYASYIYQRCAEETEGNLQLQWGVEQNELWKMKTAARATIDYKHIVFNSSLQNMKRYERVTFHPNYSYAQFVGTYKPITKIINGKEEITYDYVPGPFIRTFINAKKLGQNVLLLIEEINRANVTAVFGDVFQLLDRDEYGNSEYPITTSEDLRNFLAEPENLGGKPEDYETISLPSNMYIWATMNSADQGVFPMDTAFKRRWEFEYIGIDDNEKDISNIFIPLCKEGNISQKAKWNNLRKAINNKLISLGINEDKLLGPFFLSKSVLESAMDNGKDFVKLFESKVLMYLFEDAAKMKVRDLFYINNNKYIYSEVCKKFEKDGLDVFKLNAEDKVSYEDIKSESYSNGELFTDEA